MRSVLRLWVVFQDAAGQASISFMDTPPPSDGEHFQILLFWSGSSCLGRLAPRLVVLQLARFEASDLSYSDRHRRFKAVPVGKGRNPENARNIAAAQPNWHRFLYLRVCANDASVYTRYASKEM